MPLKYNDTVLATTQDWTVAQKIAEELMVKIQIAAIFQKKFTKKEFDALEKMIVQLMTAPRGLIPEC